MIRLTLILILLGQIYFGQTNNSIFGNYSGSGSGIVLNRTLLINIGGNLRLLADKTAGVFKYNKRTH